MSRIFDALQRSENEEPESGSETLPQGPDLLRRAERRVASRWEAAATRFETEAARSSEGAVIAEPVTTPSAGPALAAPNLDEIRAEKQSPDDFSRCQSLSVSLPAQSRLVCVTDRENPTAEAIRLLGVRLRDLSRERQLKKVLITSTIPQEGKSMISANLACALAHTSRGKVLLVEGDLRRPSLAQVFGLQRIAGLREWLTQEGGPLTNIYRLKEADIWILPAGKALTNPLELLQSTRLTSLMDELAAWFDWIVIDSPPVLPLADTSIWMRTADGILLVTRQGTTEKQQLQKGLEALDQKKLLGALMNGSTASVYSGYYYRSSMTS